MSSSTEIVFHHSEHNVCKNILNCINLHLPIVILKKKDFDDMQNRLTYMHINFQSNHTSNICQIFAHEPEL